MNISNIHILINKYWNCETTLQEEQELQEFFSGENVPADLQQYIPLFSYIKEERTVTTNSNFISNLFNSIENQQEKSSSSKKQYITIRIFAPLLRIAASVLLIFGLGVSIFFVSRQNNKPHFVDTYHDPSAAIKDATFALQKLSDAIRISEMASIQTIQIIDELEIDWYSLDSLNNVIESKDTVKISE